MHSIWSIHMMDREPALGKKLSLGQASSDESNRIFNSNFLVHFPSVVGKSYQRDKLRGNEVTRCSIKISMRHHHPVTFSIVILPNCKTSSDGFKGRFFLFFLRKNFCSQLTGYVRAPQVRFDIDIYLASDSYSYICVAEATTYMVHGNWMFFSVCRNCRRVLSTEKVTRTLLAEKLFVNTEKK